VNFDLSPEQYLLGETIGDYLRAEYPVASTLARAEATGHDIGWDTDAWKGLADLGLAGIAVPGEHGGLGLGVLDLAVAAQALGHGAAPGPWLAHWLAGLAVLRAGSGEQRTRWLPGLADGSVRATVAWNERGTPALGARPADLVVVRDGDSLGLIETDGISAKPLRGVDYTRPIDTVELVRQPEPLPGAGADAVAWLRAAGHTLVAADCFGGSLRALEESVAYAKTRRQFGRLIGSFQAVKHQVANLALLVEPGRGLFWYAAYAIDDSLPDAIGAAALAKAHLSEVYVQAVRDAIELHGGFGYTWECDLHVYLKRALLNREFLGDPETLRQELALAEFGPVEASA
jgi:alkylation response protein AidB-like acyl-CoA dehydrogenase